MHEFIACTWGFPATWHDKTNVLYDDFTKWIHDSEVLPDFEFKLLEYNSNGDVISVQYQDVWLLFENGYLNWSCIVPPYKETNSYKHLLFSEWAKSTQKDIECTFGILKGRFCIVKYVMKFQKVEECDNFFKTLCALHNMLIKSDGLDTNWMGYDQLLMQDQQKRDQLPPMLLCLHSLYVEQMNATSRSSDTYVAPGWKRKL